MGPYSICKGFSCCHEEIKCQKCSTFIANCSLFTFSLFALLLFILRATGAIRLCCFTKENQEQIAPVALFKRAKERVEKERFTLFRMFRTFKSDLLFEEWFALFKSRHWRENFKLVLFTLLFPFLSGLGICFFTLSLSLIKEGPWAIRSHRSLKNSDCEWIAIIALCWRATWLRFKLNFLNVKPDLKE